MPTCRVTSAWGWIFHPPFNAEFNLSLSHKLPSFFLFIFLYIYIKKIESWRFLANQKPPSTPGLPRLNSHYCSTGPPSPEGGMHFCSDAIEHSNYIVWLPPSGEQPTCLIAIYRYVNSSPLEGADDTLFLPVKHPSLWRVAVGETTLLLFSWRS